MVTRRAYRPISYAAALLALLLLLMAVVKSDLMRIAAPGSATASCAQMAGGGATAGPGRATLPARTCPYCDLAAHLPLPATVLGVPIHWRIVWVPVPPLLAAQPRAPPPFRPKARAPPGLPIA